jgi:hypothetical protein
MCNIRRGTDCNSNSKLHRETRSTQAHRHKQRVRETRGRSASLEENKQKRTDGRTDGRFRSSVNSRSLRQWTSFCLGFRVLEQTGPSGMYSTHSVWKDQPHCQRWEHQCRNNELSFLEGLVCNASWCVYVWLWNYSSSQFCFVCAPLLWLPLGFDHLFIVSFCSQVTTVCLFIGVICGIL